MPTRCREQLDSKQFEVKTWSELNDFYENTVALYQRQFGVLQLIILMMVLLSVANSVNMSVFERVGEFGTMMALGNRSGEVFRLIVTENILLGVCAAQRSVSSSGMLLAWVISAIGIPMPPPPASDLGYTAHIRVLPSTLVTSFQRGLSRDVSGCAHTGPASLTHTGRRGAAAKRLSPQAMRKITPGPALVFACLFLLAIAFRLTTTCLLLDLLPLGDFRGVSGVVAAILFVYLYALALYRCFLSVAPLQEGPIAPGSREEFIYHVYLLFYSGSFLPDHPQPVAAGAADALVLSRPRRPTGGQHRTAVVSSSIRRLRRWGATVLSDTMPCCSRTLWRARIWRWQPSASATTSP